MTAESPVLDALRRETAGVHRALDRSVIVARPGATAEDWRRFLAATLGWVEPLEARLWEGLTSAGEPPPGLLPEADARFTKAERLADDLLELGLTAPGVAALPRCPFPALREPSALLGAAYVVEGSTLGGRFLRRLAAEALPGARLDYLGGYGEETGRRWRRLVAALERFGERHPTGVPRMADTARRTFETVHGWMGERGCLADSGEQAGRER